MKRMILSARDQAMAKLVAEETAKAIAVELRAILDNYTGMTGGIVVEVRS